jgi:GrpB-like predicted nucleotidyltransferase (UPF0157 family)
VTLGLAHNENRLVAYDPDWPQAFERERERLATALAGLDVSIEHYGSTAVPGFVAKPILDILVGVPKEADWQACHDPLIGLGYDFAADAGVPGHHIFGRGAQPGERSHLVHVVERDGKSWVENLAFRDALRADPVLRQRYLALKRTAAVQSPKSREGYNALKSAYIAGIKQRLTQPGWGRGASTSDSP